MSVFTNLRVYEDEAQWASYITAKNTGLIKVATVVNYGSTRIFHLHGTNVYSRLFIPQPPLFYASLPQKSVLNIFLLSCSSLSLSFHLEKRKKEKTFNGVSIARNERRRGMRLTVFT